MELMKQVKKVKSKDKCLFKKIYLSSELFHIEKIRFQIFFIYLIQYFMSIIKNQYENSFCRFLMKFFDQIIYKAITYLIYQRYYEATRKAR